MISEVKVEDDAKGRSSNNSTDGLYRSNVLSVSDSVIHRRVNALDVLLLQT